MEGCNKVDIKSTVLPMEFVPANNKLEQEVFDIVSQKLMKHTCKHRTKKIALESDYENFCNILDRTVMYGINAHYDLSSETYRLILEEGSRNNTQRKQLEKYEFELFRYLFKYRRENIINFKVRLGRPEITKIEHELKMSSLDLIATVGGLIGLMVGFSITSLFELLFHCCALGYGRINPKDLNKEEGF